MKNFQITQRQRDINTHIHWQTWPSFACTEHISFIYQKDIALSPQTCQATSFCMHKNMQKNVQLKPANLQSTKNVSVLLPSLSNIGKPTEMNWLPYMGCIIVVPPEVALQQCKCTLQFFFEEMDSSEGLKISSRSFFFLSVFHWGGFPSLQAPQTQQEVQRRPLTRREIHSQSSRSTEMVYPLEDFHSHQVLGTTRISPPTFIQRKQGRR